MAQDRKVFVGGVPQDLNQDDLYAIFSEYAGVKKAWLQKCRAGEDGGSSPPQNHRGFGFVIFHDAHAIDELLGTGTSRFIVLRNGTKLEVKRALSSNKMGQEAMTAVGPEAARTRGPQAGRAEQQPPLHATGLQRSLGGARVLPGGGSAVDATAVLRHLTLMQQQQQVAAALSGGHQALAHLIGSAALGHGTDAANLLLESLPPAYAPLPRHVAAPMAAPSVSSPPGLAGGLMAPGLAQGGAAAAQRDPQGRNIPLREAIVRFYHEHRPEKLTEHDFIDFICNAYEGRAAELNEALRQKYSIGLNLPAAAEAKHPHTAADLMSCGANVSGGHLLGNPYMQSLVGVSADPNYVKISADSLGAWLPMAATQRATAPTDRSPLPSPWSMMGARGGHFPDGFNNAFGELDYRKPMDAEAPDLSWVEQMVSDDSYSVSERDVSTIVSKHATMGRQQHLQSVAVTGF